MKEPMKREWPVLYHTDKNGKMREWHIGVSTDGNVMIRHGQVSGVLQEDTRSDIPQPEKWAQSRWEQKRNRGGYVEESTRQENIRPMLATTFHPDKDRKMVFPVYVQPKLDGIRCIASVCESGVILTSRTGVALDSPALDEVRTLLGGLITKISKNHPDGELYHPDGELYHLDGELYHPDIPFEDLSGMCRRHKGGGLDTYPPIRFYVFDVICNMSFHERWGFLQELLENYPYLVDTKSVLSMDDLYKAHSDYTADGYEGVMIRSYDGSYEAGYRSASLKKYKVFHEEEFEIVGYTQGEGRDKGTVIWECKTQTGKDTFRVRPRGSIQHRMELYKNAIDVIGKKLTVIFQEMTRDGIPRFPVGKSIRDFF